jgi:hypothetical protein
MLFHGTHLQYIHRASRFHCTVNGCSKSYKRYYDLLRHRRKHSGIKPHVCYFARCNRSGTNGFERRDHLATELLGVCDICISFGCVSAWTFPECLEWLAQRMRWVQSRSITSFLGLWNFENHNISILNQIPILLGRVPQTSRNVNKASCVGFHSNGKVGIPLLSLAHRDCHFRTGEGVSIHTALYHMKITFVLIS